jgi:hypothetical protein
MAQASCYTLSLVAEKMMNKPEGLSSLDVWNKTAGCEIKRAAMFHAIFYTFNCFKNAVEKDDSQINKEVIKNLCLLFGVSSLLKNSGPIIEGGFITPDQICAMMRVK